MVDIEDHPLRYELANELHARPFPSMHAPCTVAYLALKYPEGVGDARKVELDRLTALLDRHGVPHPQPGATHYYAQIGRHWLKWEQHTEFVTYTIFAQGLGDRPFDPEDFAVFSQDWLSTLPGQRVTSILMRVETRSDEEAINGKLGDWFVPESLAASEVVDGSAVIAGDFRIDPNGHVRFGLFFREGTGPRRVGRVIQRLCEVETYKAMSMLGYAKVRELEPRLSEIDSGLVALVGQVTQGGSNAEATLDALLGLSAEIETISAQTSFRFGATGAYEAIVNQRIRVLREVRWKGRQTFSEFMMRRYEPAMRTVKSVEGRLEAMRHRAERTANLLRTRVDVERSAQNQKLLESMDRRSDLQLRLQHTVEGLSVVAISYYAVSLATYMLAPSSGYLGLSKGVMTAMITPVVILAVWLSIKALRRKIEK